MNEPNSPREAVEQHRAQLAGEMNKLESGMHDMPLINPISGPTARFKIGDVVILRSGGPRMTVWEVRTDGLVATNWFAGDELRRDNFGAAELELAPPKETV